MEVVSWPGYQKQKCLNMRPFAGIFAYLAVVMIAVIILINEWIKKRKDNLK